MDKVQGREQCDHSTNVIRPAVPPHKGPFMACQDDEVQERDVDIGWGEETLMTNCPWEMVTRCSLLPFKHM